MVEINRTSTPTEQASMSLRCGRTKLRGYRKVRTAEFLTEVVKHHGEQISNIGGEIIKVTLTNTAGEAFFNNSAKTIALSVNRDSFDYTVTAEVVTPVDNVGDIIVYDKQVNGFKVKYTGSAASVDLKLYVQGGNAA